MNDSDMVLPEPTVKVIEIPPQLQNKIGEALLARGLSLSTSKELATAVQKLSDFYIANPEEPTPWQHSWAQIAYIAYYLPLNFLRAKFVAEEAVRLGFLENVDRVVDIGSGLGSASFALYESVDSASLPKEVYLCEQAHEARELQESFFTLPSSIKVSSSEWFPARLPETGTLGIMSYSFTEMSQFPELLESFDALMIIEPSTKEDGRRLLQLRQSLIEKGYHAWAPCLHQDHCPLLTHSQTDWCHHKLETRLPDWFQKFASRLPMRTEVLSLSYLLMRKEPAPKQPFEARVIGDPLREKGKVRQLICRGPEREFLSWLKRHHKKPKGFERHGLIENINTFEKSGNELRVPPE